jgi:DNA-binding SARP family transcriptional activator
MARLSVSLLGSIEVTLDGEPVTDWKYSKVLALLAFLVVESGRAHRRDALAALLWPGYPDRVARTNLRNALSHLRAVIHDRTAIKHPGVAAGRAAPKSRGAYPPYLLVTRETIQFNADSDHWLDVAALQAAVEDDGLGVDRLEGAVALYGGPFLGGFTVDDSPAFEDWSRGRREQLQRQALSALSQLSDQYEARGEMACAREVARRHVSLAPWEESAHRRLMRLLAENGQRSAALIQYETCRRVLRDELDVEPSAETTAVYERIRDGELSGSRTESTAKPDVAPQTHNLPVPLTPLVGRDKELAEVVRLLRDPDRWLVTLVGVDGIGKTHLAVAVVTGSLSETPDDE